MKEISTFFIIIFTTFLTSCNSSIDNKKNDEHQKSIISIDTVKENDTDNDSPISYYDSIANVKIDTTTLEGKRQKILNNFIIENTPSSPDYDTLLDLTYDGYNDYVIGYYGQAGTGIKNRVKVYFFNPNLNSYILNEQLSDLPNPTFYIQQKKITGFYIGNGGGGGGKLEWLKNQWTTTKEFSVDNEGDTTKWQIKYPLKNKTKVIIRPYEMIPPQEILETNIKWY